MSYWNAHVYDPRTKTTKTYTVRSRVPRSMAYSRLIAREVAQEHHVSEEYVLAVPKPKRHRRS